MQKNTITPSSVLLVYHTQSSAVAIQDVVFNQVHVLQRVLAY